jgi:hypothetical protein
MDGTEETATSTQSTKTEKKGKPHKKAAKKTAKAKEPKPKKEKTPKVPLVVFAFRLTEEQRDRIHNAAGPGKATRFVRTAALAAASGDRPAFEELLKSNK